MKLFLLRHAHALPGKVDETRRLSPKGRRQVRGLSQAALAEALSAVRAIEHSPLVRSLETAQLLQKHFKVRIPLRMIKGVAPEDSAELTARELGKSTSPRLIVGHNPHLSILSGMLLGLKLGAEGIKFRKAALVALERLARPSPQHPYGKWRLLWMVVPADDTANS
jgi:phosphohistidine phosphatase